jgi:hypothetical protein
MRQKRRGKVEKNLKLKKRKERELIDETRANERGRERCFRKRAETKEGEIEGKRRGKKKSAEERQRASPSE